MMKKAIITGATGFVGRAVLQELLDNGYYITVVGRSNHKNKLPKDPNVIFVECNMEDISLLVKKMPAGEYDVFYHFAWQGVSGPSRADTWLQLQNAQWTVDALKAAKAVGCKRFVCAGSIMEHETMAATYTQGNRPGMGYIYGGGKVIAHMMCKPVAVDIGIELIWPSVTNAYGVGEVSERMVNTTIQKCVKGEAPQFTAGTQNYDFVYIDDVARAFRLIGEKGKSFHEYLIGSATARPLKEFLLEMKDAIAPNLEFKFGDVPFTGIDLPLNKFDCSKTMEDTGFRAEISFAEGCRRTFEWWEKKYREIQNNGFEQYVRM